MANVRIVNLTKKFEDVAAVDGIDLDIADGEFLTLLGPSGCGKTTTLRTLAGFYQPDSGEVWFGDRLMNNVLPNKRSASMCFQSYALFPHMSVAENISFGLRMRKVPLPEQKKRIAEVMAMVGLEGLEKRKPGQLSGGQQQRVALARAIVTQPEILLFDEPLSNLDAKLRVQVRVEIREMQKRLGITAIYVTHDQDEALAISDRIVIMNRGRIEQIGTPHEIYLHPRTSFVAGFIGLANIFGGRVASVENGRLVVETAFGRITIIDKDSAAKVGEEVRFSWRPEDMTLAQTDSPNRIKATIMHSIFMGRATDLFIDAGGQRMRAVTSNAIEYASGDPIELSIDEKSVRLLRG